MLPRKGRRKACRPEEGVPRSRHGMLPQKRTEASDTEDGRGNFRVRVIGGGSSPSAALREEDSRGLQIGLRIGTTTARTAVPDEDYDEEEPVRLEAEDTEPPVKARDMSEVEPAVAAPAAPPRGKKQRKWDLKSWTVGMAIGSCVIAATAVVAQLAARKAPAATVQAPVVAAPVDPYRQEVDYLVNHVATLLPEAEDLLQRYATAKSPAEVLPLVRHAEAVGARLTAKWKPWEGSLLAPGEKIENIVEYKAAWPSMLLRGKKGNFEDFEFQFVREDGVLKIDWEASEGMGDCSVVDLEQGFKAENATVRVKVTPSSFYTPMFPESGFRSYQLSDLTRYEFVWAFAPVGSPEAEFLSKALDEDSKILSKRELEERVVRVTLKLNGPMAAGTKIFLVTGVLHKGWVTP